MHYTIIRIILYWLSRLSVVDSDGMLPEAHAKSIQFVRLQFQRFSFEG